MFVTCPHCHQQISILASQAGAVVDCGNCKGKFQAPLPAAAPGYGGYHRNVSPEVANFASKKIAAGLCGILLGTFGVHKFILGFNNAGAIMLVCSIVGICGSIVIIPIFLLLAIQIVGLIEGILYLTKSDEEFYQLYAVQKKEWF